MTVCINHPQREAVMNIPDNLCDLCWEMWFTEGYHEDMPEEELIKCREKDLRRFWKDHVSPSTDEEEEILQEMRDLTKKEFNV